MAYDRITTTKDVHHTDGRLLVQKGATGFISSRHCGDVYVLFDADQAAYVELTGCGQPLQRVPFIYTRPLDS